MFIIKSRAKGQEKNTEYRIQNTTRLGREFRISNFEFRICHTSVFCLLLLANSLCVATGDERQKTRDEIWDPAKYISIDEVRPGMQAYCLSCIKGTEAEKFDLDVLSVVRNIEPGRDAILVQSTDERFIHAGPIAGCSGSPVYIDGRLAGAIAFAWVFSKDPLYGVTPIEEMLKVGASDERRRTRDERAEAGYRIAFDFSRPIDFAEIDRQIANRKSQIANRKSQIGGLPGVATLPCPLIVSGLPAEACGQLEVLAEPYGLMVVSGSSGGADAGKGKDLRLVPGAVLTVPLVAGDITMTVLGTATLVADDKVYAFGHSFLGYGPIDLPMATGQVHAVVSNLARSFKLGSPLEIVGALTTDESTAVFGRIGAKPQMLPLTIKVVRYNDTGPRVFNCQVAYNRLLTPDLVRVAVSGATFYLGSFPPDHMIEYKVAIGIENAEAISFENISTGVTIAEMVAESIGSVALLMDNPFREIDIKSLNFDIRILPKNIISHIWSVDLSDSRVKASQQIKIEAVVESYLSEKKKHEFSLKIPDELPPGKYELIVCGSSEYEQYLRKAVPYRFMAQDLTSLIKALNDALSIERDKLYCLLVLPPSGVAVERAELPDLPATKALVLQNATRALRTQPYPQWIEKSLKTGTVVSDKKTMRITVEK